MALLDHVTDIAFASSIPTDLILGTFTGSVSATVPVSTIAPQKASTSTVIATGINEKTFFQGVFSTDGGTTWVDFNSNIPVTYGSTANLQTQLMYAYSKPGTLTVVADNWNYTGHAGIGVYAASAYTFMYKVVLFAGPWQGDISPQTVGQQRNFSSFTNYQKIFRDSTYNFSLPVGTSTSTITHSLGYVPKFRSYIDNFSSGLVGDNTALYDFGYLISQYFVFQAYMDNDTIKYYVDNTSVSTYTGTIYTRIYYADN